MYPTNTVVDINAPRRIPHTTSMLSRFRPSIVSTRKVVGYMFANRCGACV